jgi:predicted DNA-binding transcriptional regulator AlpA
LTDGKSERVGKSRICGNQTLAAVIVGDSTPIEDCKMQTTQTPNELAQMLDVAAVALMLGVSGRHVFRLADAGRMPRPIKLGGAVRWSRMAILDWIANGCPSIDSRQGGARQ